MKNDLKLIGLLAGAAVLAAVCAAGWVARAVAAEKPLPGSAGSGGTDPSAASVHDFVVRDNAGAEIPLSAYRGKVLLIVNTASRCGLTPQYAGLQSLYERYRGRGFEVLAFPANNFLGQEPGTDAEIREFCSTRFGVGFPLFSKISVKGGDIHPLYRFLTTRPGFSGEIGWNFAKFLVGPDGVVLARFGPRQEPLADEVVAAVEAALAALDAPPGAAGPAA